MPHRNYKLPDLNILHYLRMIKSYRKTFEIMLVVITVFIVDLTVAAFSDIAFDVSIFI